MPDLTSAISTAQQTADMEMTTYLSQLDDSSRSNYVGQNVGAALDRIKANKSDRFTYLNEDLLGADNNLVSTAYYIARTQDLKQVMGDVDSVAAQQVSTSDINADLIRRQTEINEWANSNKLDTLYFLQILFVCLSFISALMFLKSSGFISPQLLNLFIILTAFLSVFVLITRARFTNVKRNNRYWSKQRFGPKPPPDTSAPACPSDVAAAVNKCEPKKKEDKCAGSGWLAETMAGAQDAVVGWGEECPSSAPSAS